MNNMTMTPVSCYVKVLRRGVGLTHSERMALRKEEEWSLRYPELVAQLDALVAAEMPVRLVRPFKAIDGTRYPKGMNVIVVARWYGNLIVYSKDRALLLSVRPDWIEHAKAKAKKVSSPDTQSGTG